MIVVDGKVWGRITLPTYPFMALAGNATLREDGAEPLVCDTRYILATDNNVADERMAADVALG